MQSKEKEGISLARGTGGGWTIWEREYRKVKLHIRE